MTDRTHLAAAHQELALAEERLGKIEAALAETYGTDLTAKREAAERELADARNFAPQAWVDSLIGGKPPPDLVARAEEALAEAVAAEEAANQKRRMLRAEEIRCRDLVERSRTRLRQEAVAVIRASPEAAALREENDRCERRLDAISEAASRLPSGAIGIKYIRPTTSDADRTLANAWVAALAAVEADPEAPLPSDAPA
jgi:hypothetical protein